MQPFENVKIYKEMYDHPDNSVLMAIHLFVNFDVFKCYISVITSLMNTELGDLVNLGCSF